MLRIVFCFVLVMGTLLCLSCENFKSYRDYDHEINFVKTTRSLIQSDMNRRKKKMGAENDKEIRKIKGRKGVFVSSWIFFS